MTSKKKNTSSTIKLFHELIPKTQNQAEYIRCIAENPITICYGPAGSGKTMISVGLACEYWVAQKVDKIIITRPIVESGKSMGFLKGTMEEKVHPYLIPLLDHFEYFIGRNETENLMADGVIEVAPLNFMRGRTFNKSFVILDEASNATYSEMKLLLTRLGMKSKIVLNGDTSQSDLPNYESGDFQKVIDRLKDCDVVGISELTMQDIVRNPIIAKILEKLR